MLQFKPSVLTLALVAAGASMSSYAAEEAKAETSADESIEVISVTGIRRSLQDSKAIKMTSSSIVEAISAEDIGKLPDVSIADSLARLPGLTTQRLNGRGQVISVRGLSPDFTNTTLNGRQQVSASDNRSVEYDMYPSELLSGAVVYKTPDASLMAQGIAGTIDMQTVRPLAHGEQTFSVNARYEWNELESLNPDVNDSGQRVSASYIDQFADNTIGLVLGVSYMDTPSQGERFNAWGYPQNEDGNYVIGGAKPFVQSNELKRTAIVATLEFQPTENLHSTFDLFYTDFNEAQTLRGIEFPLAWSGATLTPGTVQNGMVTDGTFNGVEGIMRNDLEQRDSDTVAAGWNLEYDLGEWQLEGDLSYSKNERTDEIYESYSQITSALDNLKFKSTTKGTVFESELDYADTDLVKLSGPNWAGNVGLNNGQVGYYKQPASKDELYQIRLSASHDLDWGLISRVEFGANYDDRTKSKTTIPEYYYTLSDSDCTKPGDSSTCQKDINFNTFTTNLGFLGIPGMVSYDPRAAFDSLVEVEALRADIAAKAWEVSEQVTTAYIKFDIDTDIWDMRLTGNVGTQVVYTEQSSSAVSATDVYENGIIVDVTIVPIEDGTDYTEILPSLNLSLALSDSSILRFGAARTLTRPRMDELRASSTYSFDPKYEDSTDPEFSPWSASGGNPQLEPWIANGVDLSFEHYFDDSVGYVSIAGFYKDLESYVYTQPEAYDFSEFPTGGYNPALDLGAITKPQNGDGGSLKGLELAASISGAMLTEVLEDFGAIASASFTTSDIQPNPDSPSEPLPGLSEDVYNLTFYYENSGFSARVVGRYRSEFLGEVSGFDAGRSFRYNEPETIVDAQISYRFQEGTLEGLTLLLQANNLTDEPFVTTEEGDEMRVIDYQRYGTNYAFGASYQF
ncbi:TonB-dependent receptor [Shewanella sp. 10N.286.54.B9]|uniref:TonB-dependent receptor n=1 Tax=Shewanella sp. 10N.286.54.B9 TaxID=3229719 RepID=UPI00354D61B4